MWFIQIWAAASHIFTKHGPGLIVVLAVAKQGGIFTGIYRKGYPTSFSSRAFLLKFLELHITKPGMDRRAAVFDGMFMERPSIRPHHIGRYRVHIFEA